MDLSEWQRAYLRECYDEGTLLRLEQFIQHVRIFPMNPCKVEGCGKTDDEKAMAFRGEPYCSDVHRKVLSGELTLVKTETISVEAVTKNENSVVE